MKLLLRIVLGLGILAAGVGGGIALYLYRAGAFEDELARPIAAAGRDEGRGTAPPKGPPRWPVAARSTGKTPPAVPVNPVARKPAPPPTPARELVGPPAPPGLSPAELAALFDADPAKAAARLAAREAKERRASVEVFDAHTPPDAPGRAEGLEALRLAARHLARPGRPDWTMVPADEQLTKAVAAGCTDPLVGYYHARFAEWVGRHQTDDRAAIAAAMANSKYPPVRKMHVFYNTAVHFTRPGPVPADRRAALTARYREAFWSAFREVAADPATAAEVLSLVELVAQFPTLLGNSREVNWERVTDALGGPSVPEAVRLTADGMYHVHLAWGTRGMVPTFEVPPAERETVATELAAARASLVKAADLDPTLAAPATYMLAVCAGTRRRAAEADRWFARAMTADPDNPEACRRRLVALEVKWGGQPAAMRAFAEACVESANWDAGVPQATLAAIAHDRASHSPSVLRTGPSWTITQKLFDAWLAAHPDSRWAKTLYAQSATEHQRFDVADPLFRELGRNPWPGVYPYQVEYDRHAVLARLSAADPKARPTIGYTARPESKRRDEVRAAREAWLAAASASAFEAANPVDAAARGEGLAAVRAVARALAIPYDRNPRTDAAVEALRAAVRAGSDDPFVRYQYVRLGLASGLLEADDAAARLGKAAAALAASRYPPVLKLPAALDAAAYGGGGEDTGRAAAARVDAFWKVFQAAAADPDPFAQREVLRTAVELIQSESLGGTRQGTHARAKKALADAKADPYQGLVLDGIELTSAAWDVRGGGFGNTVSKAQWETFFAGLRDARAHLEAAWRLSPNRPEAPVQMLSVCMGSQAARAEMEEWYARAIQADPDTPDALRRKALFLEPKWYGSKDGMDLMGTVADALNAGNWDGGFGDVAFQLQLVARGLWQRTADDPGEWSQTEQLFAKLWLKATPNSRYAKTLYARAALEAKQLKVADRLFRELGDAPWPGVFPSREIYKQIAEAVRREVGGDLD